jgi:hypothetical protein
LAVADLDPDLDLDIKSKVDHIHLSPEPLQLSTLPTLFFYTALYSSLFLSLSPPSLNQAFVIVIATTLT